MNIHGSSSHPRVHEGRRRRRLALGTAACGFTLAFGAVFAPSGSALAMLAVTSGISQQVEGELRTTRPMAVAALTRERSIALVAHRASSTTTETKRVKKRRSSRKSRRTAGNVVPAGRSRLRSLPWPSGISCWYGRGFTLSEFQRWRGARVDALHGWAPRTSWEDMLRYFRGGSYGKFVRAKVSVISISVPLFIQAERGRFDRCAAGAFDTYFEEIGRITRARGGRPPIIRLGWEANLKWAPWAIGNRVEEYKACFRRVARALRRGNPDLKIEWPLGRGNKIGDWRRAYPGDDVVDLIGLSYYDRYPPIRTQADWETYAFAPPDRRVLGIETFLAFAKEHGKKVGIGEWAISDGGAGGGFDNPLFIENMYRFFERNAEHIAYETYFNCGRKGVYRVYPSTHNPDAAAAYRRLWSGKR